MSKKNYLENVKGSFKSLLLSWANNTPQRGGRIKSHLTKVKQEVVEEKQLKTQLGKGAKWLTRLSTKGFDLLSAPELADLFWQLVKFNTRSMTALEMAEAHKVFKNTLPYHQIRIDEYSLIAKLGALFNNAPQMGVCTFHTINFTRPLKVAAGNRDMAWLIHELVHVAQMQQVGSQYTAEAIHAQYTEGYRYGGPKGLLGKQFKDFNREQQGDIIQHYYFYTLYNRMHPRYGMMPLAAYLPMLEDLRAGNL